MKQKVLIIGGGGFIGLNIAKYLKQHRDYNITLVDTSFARNLKEYFSTTQLTTVRLLKCDLTTFANFSLLDDDYDYVYMLASIVGVNNTLQNPAEVIRVNTMLILNCLEWLKASKVSKVLFSSTSETYSGTTELMNDTIPTKEDVALCIKDINDPRFTYAITKILGESAFLNYSQKYNFNATIVRYHNAFGPDMGFKHVIPHLIERFLQNETPFKMYGHEQTRAFSFIDNTVEATVLAMEHQNSVEEIFHIGNSEEITIEELIKEVGRIMKYKGTYSMAPTFPGSVKRRCPDISKAKKVLGFKPKTSWKEGLIPTIEWYVNYFTQNGIAREDGFKEL